MSVRLRHKPGIPTRGQIVTACLGASGAGSVGGKSAARVRRAQQISVHATLPATLALAPLLPAPAVAAGSPPTKALPRGLREEYSRAALIARSRKRLPARSPSRWQTR